MFVTGWICFSDPKSVLELKMLILSSGTARALIVSEVLKPVALRAHPTFCNGVVVCVVL